MIYFICPDYDKLYLGTLTYFDKHIHILFFVDHSFIDCNHLTASVEKINKKRDNE